LIEHLLKRKINTAFLSRGYGRKTKGFLEVTSESKAKEVGDEPLQVANKFPDLTVAVCEQRILAIPEILARNPLIKSIVLDDVFQHRSIKPTINILLSTYSDPFYDDHVLPLGNLREARKGAKRADVVVITKSPVDLSTKDKEQVITKVRSYTESETPIYFSRLVYDSLTLMCGEKKDVSKYLVISAIANNDAFLNQVQKNHTVIKSFNFRDHHNFTEKEVKEIINFAHQNEKLGVITTEKDWQRLKAFKNVIDKSGLSFHIYPIRFELENEMEFWNNTFTEIEKS